MNERITLISLFDNTDINKLESYIKEIHQKTCKVPYLDSIYDRETVDTLPYHFTLSTWSINDKEKVINELKKIEFPELKLLIDNVEIMEGKGNSYILYFNISENEQLRLLQRKVYEIMPIPKYNPKTFHFHITIHIDKDKNKVEFYKKKILENFTPFELNVNNFGIFEIYPAIPVTQFSKSVTDDEYKEISPTAIVTSYPRIFTDIPYEKEIYNWLESHCNVEVALYKNMAPEIEARYKLTNKLLDKSNIKQVLELASGYSSRGLIYSKKGYNYIELDLEDVTKNKIELLKSIEQNIPHNLNIVNGNALRKSDFDRCEKYFKSDESLAVINEGLLRYLTFKEKRIVAENIYNLLSKYNGIWITSDVTPKKFIKSQNSALQDLNKNISNITTRNNLNDRFEDINHAKEFFGEIGFEILEVHKFNEVKDELYSINTLKIIDDKIEQTLEDAIIVVMKAKK